MLYYNKKDKYQLELISQSFIFSLIIHKQTNLLMTYITSY